MIFPWDGLWKTVPKPVRYAAFLLQYSDLFPDSFEMQALFVSFGKIPLKKEMNDYK